MQSNCNKFPQMKRSPSENIDFGRWSVITGWGSDCTFGVCVHLRCESNKINCNGIILGGVMAGKIKAGRIYVITIKSKLLQEFPYELVYLFHPQHIKKLALNPSAHS